jgi:pimeloyl-ACP methyl ester carboxylesterase
MMLGVCLGLLLVLQTGMENIFSIQVPIDHFNSGSREITIDYSISGIFDSSKPTVFYLEDPVDSAFGYLGIPTELKSQFNIVSIQGRYQSNELIDFLENRNESDWELNYILLNQRQVSEDLELIRRKLLGNEKVTLLGYSSSATVLHYYLSLYPDQVSTMISLSPMFFDVEGNLSFWNQFSFIEEKVEYLGADQIADFAYYSKEDFFNSSKSEKDSLLLVALDQFKTEKKSGFSELKLISIPLRVRAFELIYPTAPFSETTSKTLKSFLKIASPIFETFKKKTFLVYGLNFDKGLEFEGKVVLIGGAFDLLLNPKILDVMAEFYPNSTLLQLRDGHALRTFQSWDCYSAFLEAFISNRQASKIRVYEDLNKAHLLYLKSDYNSVRVKN